MHLSQLELLCEIVRVKKISKAAKLIDIEPEIIKNQVKSIEEFYGVSLHEEGHDGVVLNHFGQVVVKYAKEILELHDCLEKEIDSLLTSENQELSIGASPMVAEYILPCILWNFRQKYPGIQINLTSNQTEKVFSMLKAGQVDLAMLEDVLPNSEKNGFEEHHISKDELLIITPPDKEWKDKKSISLTEIQNNPLIVGAEGSGIRRMLENIIAEKGLSLDQFNIVDEVDTVDELKRAIKNRRGISLCTRVVVGKEIYNEEIHPLKLEGKSIELNYQIVYKTEAKLNSAAKRFIRLLTDPDNIRACKII